MYSYMVNTHHPLVWDETTKIKTTHTQENNRKQDKQAKGKIKNRRIDRLTQIDIERTTKGYIKPNSIPIELPINTNLLRRSRAE